MRRSFKVALFLLAFLSTALSSAALAQAFKPKSFVAPPGEPIKTIAVLKIGEPWGYFLGEGGVSSFGLAGLFASQFKRPKHPEYESAGFRFSVVAERLLTEHLKAAGFKVVTVTVEREKPYQLLRNYKALSVPSVDAYLDVVSRGVGYRQSDSAPDFARKVGPYVLVSVRLVSARSKKILYADTIEYGWRKAHQLGLPGSEIDAPDDQVFEDAEAVEMDLMSRDSRSLAQLTHGIDVAMRRIVSDFSAYPAMVLPQQAGATPRTDSPIEVAKAAPAATPSPGAAIQKGTASTRYKIAIFPFESDSLCVGRSRSSDEKLAAELRTFIKSNDSLALVYSYYHPNLNDPPIEKPGRLWRGSKPNVAQVYALGQSQGVDAVAMYWRPVAVGVSQTGCSSYDVWYPIEVYVFDVKQRKMYRLKGHERNLSAMTKQALSRFLAGATPKVVAAAPTKRSEVRSSQTASAASPFEGITLRPGGSVEAINAAAEAYCGSLNKKSRLIAGPPNNPDYVFQCYQPTTRTSAPAPPPKKTVAKAAPRVQKSVVPTAYKIAIFPFDGTGCVGRGSRPADEKFAAQLGALITRNDAMKLAYSYYDSSLNHPPIKNRRRLWKGSKPNLTQVVSAGETHGVDAIVMYWRPTPSVGNPDCEGHRPPFPIEVYVIDVKQRKTYRLKGRERNRSAMAEQALSKFLAGR
jgi:hypothetical protein